MGLDVGLGADKAAVIRALAARVAAQGRATDAEGLFADAWAREEKDETGLAASRSRMPRAARSPSRRSAFARRRLRRAPRAR